MKCLQWITVHLNTRDNNHEHHKSPIQNHKPWTITFTPITDLLACVFFFRLNVWSLLKVKKHYKNSHKWQLSSYSSCQIQAWGRPKGVETLFVFKHRSSSSVADHAMFFHTVYKINLIIGFSMSWDQYGLPWMGPTPEKKNNSNLLFFKAWLKLYDH